MVDFKIQVQGDGSQEAESHVKQAAQPNTKQKSKTKKSKLVVAVVVIIALIIGGFFFQMYRTEQLAQDKQLLTDPQQTAQQEQDRIIQEVSAIIEFPDEQPTLATINDIEKIRDQKFFANARNGDKLLLFAENKKAILYRPDTKKIIDVSTFNTDSQEGTTAGTSDNNNQ